MENFFRTSFGDMLYSQSFGKNKSSGFYIWITKSGEKKKDEKKTEASTPETKKLDDASANLTKSNTSVVTATSSAKLTNGFYFYEVKSNQGNAEISEMLGIAQKALEDANKDLHQKRGDKIIVPTPTKGFDMLLNADGSKVEMKKEPTISDLINDFKSEKIQMPDLAKGIKLFA